MRCFQKTFSNQLENLIKPNKCDVFIHTSNLISQRINLSPEYNPISKIVYKKINGKKTGMSYNIDKNELKNAIENVYGPYLKKITIAEETIEENIEKNYLISDVNRTWLWTKKIFEKTYMCNQMFNEFCLQNNEQYDIVIRSRSDLLFNAKLIFENKNFENKILSFGGWDPRGKLSEHGYKKYFFDGFAVSSPKNMDTYCSFYTEAKENTNKIPNLEPQLHDFLESKNLEYQSIGNTKCKSQKFYKIVR
jgi:hypothetical protein